MIDEMASKMTRLPSLAPPASLAANVMARVARLSDERSVVRPAVRTSLIGTESSSSERLAWVSGLAGLVIALGTYVHREMAAGTLPDFTSSRIGHVQLVTMPIEPAMLVLALGLLLYLKGLFSPLRRGNRGQRTDPGPV
jgi:hypothetical protein